jgi:APA family basic amino acid/polyamine antiporter
MLGLWLLGGLVAVCGALCYGELGAAMPRAGGEYFFLSRLFHPLLGFLSGWVSLFAGFSAPIAAAAIGISAYLLRAFPGLAAPGLLPPEVEQVLIKKAVALAMIAVVVGVQLRGMRLTTAVQNVLTVLKIGLIVLLVGAGFAVGRGSWTHFTAADNLPLDFAGWKIIGLALVWIMFAYTGWNSAAYIGSEIRNPVRNLPRALLLGAGTVILLFTALNVLFVYAVDPADMSGVISVGGLAAGRLFGASFEAVGSVLISLALLSSLCTLFILGPRVYFSMARDGQFFPFAARVHRHCRVPSRSILLQGFLAALMVLLGSFDQILTYMGLCLGIFPILAVLGVFKLRRRGESRYRLPGFPLVPLVFLAASAAILLLAVLERPMALPGAILTLLTGIPFYYHFRRRYGRTLVETPADAVAGEADAVVLRKMAG